MNLKLEIIIEKIISQYESLSLDDDGDRETLVNALVKGLTPKDYDQVVEISQAIFPTGDVEESFVDGELSVYTGLFNVAGLDEEDYRLVDGTKKDMVESFDSFDDDEDDRTIIGIVSDIDGPDMW